MRIVIATMTANDLMVEPDSTMNEMAKHAHYRISRMY